MTDIWGANVIAQLRMIGIKQKDFARMCGYSEPYMSMVLRGHKGTEQTRETIDSAIKRLKQEREIYI